MKSEIVLEARSDLGGACVIRFNETGYEVLSDDRQSRDCYLHLSDDIPEAITTACRDQLIKYLCNHPITLPGLGATPQRFFSGLTTADIERIGGGGKMVWNRCPKA